MEENWKPIPGYEDSYEVSDLGRVRSKDRLVHVSKKKSLRKMKGIILKPKTNKGYNIVILCKQGHVRTFQVHTLVLTAFVGPCPDGMECRHFPDINRKNNRLDNLSWGTRIENMADKIAQGTHYAGEKHHKSKLTTEQVAIIRELRKSGFKLKELADKFGVCYASISLICSNKNWKSAA